MLKPSTLATLLATAFMAGRAQTGPQVPDWMLPGSPTHKQVPPPADYHRPARTVAGPIGIFDGRSDVGGPIVPGSASYDAVRKQYTVRSAGYNIWYTRDEFAFAWKRFSGDASLAADAVFSTPGGYDDRKAVLVIRQSLDDDAAEAVVGEHGTGMIHLATRPAKGASMTDAQYRFGGTLAGLHAKRIGIEKRGEQVAIYISIAGERLHQFGPPVELHLSDPFYIGIGFCSHQPLEADSAVFSDVALERAGGHVR